MGRYYSGDIEGKFWFAVQSSDDASFFGVDYTESNFINYYFSKDDLPSIRKGIKECKKELKGFESKLNKFFKENDFYSDEDLKKELEITENKVKKLLKWYARLQLGEKILECVKKQGYCDFEAEL